MAAAGSEKGIIMKKKEYLSIPNLMGYFRIILIPIYLYVAYHAKTEQDHYLAVGIMLLSFLTDFLDGKIARRFHMVTDFGKILDPIADKLTQGALALSFVVRYPAVMILFCAFLCKEILMGSVGAYMIHKGFRTKGADMHGKICTALLDLTMLLLLVVPEMPYLAVNLLVGVCLMVMAVSLIMYLKMYYDVWGTMKNEQKEKEVECAE